MVTIPSVTNSEPASRLRQWLGDRDNLLFTALLTLHIAPIWYFTYFPSQDGSVHLENATILREYNRWPIFQEFYTINTQLDPNWLGHLVLAGLMYAMPALIAEKILLTGYVLLLPLSVRYTLKAIRPGAGFFAVLIFPFVHNFFYHLGFYNFSYSLPLFFFVIGYWIRHEQRFTVRSTLTLAILALLLYFCHLVSVVCAALAIAVLVFWLTALDIMRRKKSPWPSVWNTVRSGVLPLAVAFLPVLLLATLFLFRQASAPSPEVLPINLWMFLIKLEALVSYSLLELLIAMVVAFFFAATTIYLLLVKLRREQEYSWDGLLILTGVYLLVYFVAPQGVSGGLFVNQRLSLFPFFGLILWIGGQPDNKLVKRAAQVVATSTALLLLVVHTAKYAELNDYLDEYLSGQSLIESNTTLLPLSFAHAGRAPDGHPLSAQVAPFRHAAGHIAAMRRVVELDNYEADTGYFPIVFRHDLNPFVLIGRDRTNPDRGLEGQPPDVTFLNYPKPIDYVLLWTPPAVRSRDAHTVSLFRQLGQRYELIYRSPRRGLVELYRRRDYPRRPAR